MVHAKTMRMLLCMTALMFTINPINAEQEEIAWAKKGDFNDDDFSPSRYENKQNDCDYSRIKIYDLCVKCLEARRVNAGYLSADEVDSHAICVDRLKASDICTESLTVNGAFGTSVVTAPQANINNLVANSACVTDLTVGGVFTNCVKRIAAAAVSTDFVYTLGDLLNFDSILADPQGNLTVAPTAYTVPVTGYYLITMQTDLANLLTDSGSPILGTPVSALTVYANGIDKRVTYAPFLTFSSVQKVNLSGLVQLNAGDVVTAALDVLVVDPVAGEQELAGTAVLLGDGSDGLSSFSIIYLGSICDGNPCPQVPVNPLPCSYPCAVTVPCHFACPDKPDSNYVC